MAYTFPVTRTTHPKEKPDQSNLCLLYTSDAADD